MSKFRGAIFALLLMMLLSFGVWALGCGSSSNSGGSGNAPANDDDSSPAADDDDDDDDDASPADDDSALDCSGYSDAPADPTGTCAGNPNSIFPAPTGPYCVGTTAPIHLVDSSRHETFTPNDPQARRELMIQVWYPIDQNATGERAPYMDAKTAAYEASIPPATWAQMPASAFTAIQPHALLDAPFAAGKKKFPLVLFSPGLKREYQDYASLIENFVSHGYVVVATNHPYISGLTVFPDGHTVGVVLPADEAGSLAIVIADARFVMDTVTGWNADPNADQRFQCRLDLAKTAMYGHSYGGATSVGAAVADKRFMAALNYDGPTLGDVVDKGLDAPYFIMLSSEHETDPGLDPAWAKMRGPAFRADLAGARHMTYSDYPTVLHNFAPTAQLVLWDMGTIDPARSLEIIDHYQQAYFDVYLKGAPVNDLLSLAGQYSEITMQTKNVGVEGEF